MANLVSGTAFTGEVTLTKQSGTLLTLPTSGKYVDRDVEFTLNARACVSGANTASADANIQSDSSARNISGVIGTKTASAPLSGYYLKVGASGSGSSLISTSGWAETGALPTASTTAVCYFPIDSAVVSLSGSNTVTPSASVSGTNVTLSNVDNGILVSAVGGGTASASATATGTAEGYLPTGDVATGTIVASQAITTVNSYIAGVSIPIPASGTNSFFVTLPNGENDTITLYFEVDEYGNSNVTDDNIPATGVSF